MVKEGVKEQKGIEDYMQLPYSILLHQIEDDGERYWIAEIPELPGCKSHGSTIDVAVKSVEEAKKDWILDSLDEGDEIPTPIERDKFNGRALVRMSRSLHRALSLMAESEKLSLNQLIVTMLAKEVGRLGVLNRVEEKLDKMLDTLNDVVERNEPRISYRESLFNSIVSIQGQTELQGVISDICGAQVKSSPVADDAYSIYYSPIASGAAITATPSEQFSSWLRDYQARVSNLTFITAQKGKESEPENKVQLKIK